MKAGDLVRIIRVCGCSRSIKFLDRISTVIDLWGTTDSKCGLCNKEYPRAKIVVLEAQLPILYEEGWLQIIPPLTELEGQTDERDLPAPIKETV